MPIPNAPVLPPTSPIKIHESEDGAFYCYSNNMGLAWTAFDVRLEFNEIVNMSDEVPAPFTFGIERHAVVTVSWPHAKQIAIALQQMVTKYEELNGEIKSAENVKVP